MDFKSKLDFGDDICKDIAEKKRQRGNADYKVKNYQAALKSYSDAIILCPETAAYYGNRAACYMMMQNYESAIEDACTAIQLDPGFEKCYIRLIKCHLAMGNIQKAEEALKNYAVRFSANMANISSNTAATSPRDQIYSLQELKRLESKIVAYMNDKTYRVALFYLESAMKIAPSCFKYQQLRAECLILLGRSYEIYDFVLDTMRQNPTSAEAVFLRGLCMYFTDYLDKAIIHFERALHLDHDHSKAKSYRIRAKILRDFKDDGNRLFVLKKYDEAIAAYSNALNVDPQNDEVNSKLFYNRALVNRKIGALNNAIADCTSALAINSSYVKVFVLRGSIFKDVGEFEKSVKDLEKACRLDDGSYETTQLLNEARLALKKSKRKDYYKILGIDKHVVDVEDIKKSYHRQAMKHHPDRHAAGTEEERKEAESKFKEIGEAYAVLSDPIKRKRYDKGIDMQDIYTDPDTAAFYRTFFCHNNNFHFW